MEQATKDDEYIKTKILEIIKDKWLTAEQITKELNNIIEIETYFLGFEIAINELLTKIKTNEEKLIFKKDYLLLKKYIYEIIYCDMVNLDNLEEKKKKSLLPIKELKLKNKEKLKEEMDKLDIKISNLIENW